MSRLMTLIYAVIAYGIFLAAFLYAIGFVGDVVVPKSVDSGPAGPIGAALAIDSLLLGVFAVQHSVMARPAFKRWWTRFTPKAIERSTYVLASSLALALLYWQWRPIAGTAWSLTGPAALAAAGLSGLGWLVVLASTFMLSHFELFGLTQAYAAFRDRSAPVLGFKTPWLYGLVRHPIMLGFLIAFWATPRMSLGHLLFAAATTIYILLALQFEEADLIAAFGDTYAAYRRRVPSLIPFAIARRDPAAKAPAGRPVRG